MPADEDARRPLRQGSRTINLNRRKYLFWPTTSRITEFIPDKKLAFRVNENRTVWSYELEPTATGTRLTESRHARERHHGLLQHVGQRV